MWECRVKKQEQRKEEGKKRLEKSNELGFLLVGYPIFFSHLEFGHLGEVDVGVAYGESEGIDEVGTLHKKKIKGW